MLLFLINILTLIIDDEVRLQSTNINHNTDVFYTYLFWALFAGRKIHAAQSDTSDTDTQKRIDERLSLAADKLRKVEGEKVPLQYIVVLKDSNAQASSVRALADEIRVNGTTVRHVYEHALKGFAIKISNERVFRHF